MKKNKMKIIALAVAVFVALLIALLLPYDSKLKNVDFYIFDANDNFNYETYEKLSFRLNDSLAVKGRLLKWYFGNGDSIVGKHRNVTYKYERPGKYLITLDVDSKHEVSKYIKVIASSEKEAIDSIPKIYAVSEGYVGEDLVFTAEGEGVNAWSWEFGESGTIDGYEQQVVYAYSTPGRYTVKLQTNTLKYPVYHDINILPKFEKVDETAVAGCLELAQNNIKKRLQKIADASVSDRRVFFKNLDFIKKKYICHNIKDVVVVVNNSEYNDLYSYCQGLHYLEGGGKKRVFINKVTLDTCRCVRRIEVVQSISE